MPRAARSLPSVEVQPGFWLYLVALAAVGTAMAGAVGADTFEAKTIYGLLFASSSACLLLVHETGHALGGAAVGMVWDKLTLGLGRAAAHLGSWPAVTNRQRFWSTLSGPALQAAVAGALLTVEATAGRPLGAVGFAATVGLVEAAANLLLPLPGLDCHQLIASGRRLAAGRGHLPETDPVSARQPA